MPRPLLPWPYHASWALGLSCACSVVLTGGGLVAERHAAAAARSPATLLVASVAPDEARRSATLGRLEAALVDDARLTLTHPHAADTLDPSVAAGAARSLPSPGLLEVAAPTTVDLPALAARLRRWPGVTVQILSTTAPPSLALRPAGLLVVALALVNAGWSAHLHVRRRTPLLLLLRRTGATPGQLLTEALAPTACSGGGGAVAGAALTALLIGPGDTWATAVPVSAALTMTAALLGTLGSLRRLMTALP